MAGDAQYKQKISSCNLGEFLSPEKVSIRFNPTFRNIALKGTAFSRQRCLLDKKRKRNIGEFSHTHLFFGFNSSSSFSIQFTGRSRSDVFMINDLLQGFNVLTFDLFACVCLLVAGGCLA